MYIDQMIYTMPGQFYLFSKCKILTLPPSVPCLRTRAEIRLAQCVEKVIDSHFSCHFFFEAPVGNLVQYFFCYYKFDLSFFSWFAILSWMNCEEHSYSLKLQIGCLMQSVTLLICQQILCNTCNVII
jgi:hypothetical protein